MIYYPAAAFVIAIALGFVVIPILKRLAFQFGLVDRPDARRKLHSAATPMIGGISAFVCAIATLTILCFAFPEKVTLFDNHDSRSNLGLLIASCLILALGIADDRFNIRGRQKLLGQILASLVLVCFGYSFSSLDIFGEFLNFQALSPIVACAWILVGINSVNLLDGADGFATTIGALMSLALCVMAFHVGRFDDAIICAAACGALLAFMRFNFPPASAYLGDAGSMLIGLFVAAMAMKIRSKEAAAYAFLAPIALLAIPMFDTMAAIVRRRLTGRSIYTVDRGHLHHALMGKGFSPRKALLVFAGMCLMTATGGVFSLIYREAEYAIFSVFAVGLFLVIGRVFGYAEFQLISNRSRSLLRSFFVLPEANAPIPNRGAVQLQGKRDWQLPWQLLHEFAVRNDLLKLSMDLNLPWIHESFHGSYASRDRKTIKAEERWTFQLPLYVDQRMIGRIKVESNDKERRFATVLLELNKILTSLDPYFVETIGSSIDHPTTMSDESSANVDSEQEMAEKQSIEFGGEDQAKSETNA